MPSDKHLDLTILKRGPISRTGDGVDREVGEDELGGSTDTTSRISRIEYEISELKDDVNEIKDQMKQLVALGNATWEFLHGDKRPHSCGDPLATLSQELATSKLEREQRRVKRRHQGRDLGGSSSRV